MRLLADENVELTVIQALRGAGHDVLAVVEQDARAADEVVLEKATTQGRVVVTNDKDFAWLLFFMRKAAQGVVLLRMGTSSSVAKARRTVDVLATEAEGCAGHMLVVEIDNVRRKPIPGLDSSREN